MCLGILHRTCQRIRGGDYLQIDRDLTGEFAKEHGISKLIILEEPKVHDGNFGNRVDARVQCNDTKKTIAIWSINKTSKNILIDHFGNDTVKMVGQSIPILVEPYGNNKYTINVDKEKIKQKQAAITS